MCDLKNTVLIKELLVELPLIFYIGIAATAPNQKWVTDITEFRIKDEKLYLSPILDLFNGEIISYSVREHPDFTLIKEMLSKVLKSPLQKKYPTIIHSDQGWHYQMKEYQTILKRYGIVQSMSRKGNCLDNSVMENFFGILKSELYYKKKYQDKKEFLKDLDQYIYYYNNLRIKAKLKGLSPVNYRIQSFGIV